MDTVVLLCVLLVIVRFRVTTLSHPATFVVVHVGVLVDAVYKTPCHLRESHDVIFWVNTVGSFTTTVIVVSFTQVPTVCVNVYAVVRDVLIEAGLHVPVNNPFIEVFGNIGGVGVTPWQIGPMLLNNG